VCGEGRPVAELVHDRGQEGALGAITSDTGNGHSNVRAVHAWLQTLLCAVRRRAGSQPDRHAGVQACRMGRRRAGLDDYAARRGRRVRCAKRPERPAGESSGAAQREQLRLAVALPRVSILPCALSISHPFPAQAAGLVPIVEPELLIDGSHDAAAFADASTRVIQRCVAHLWQKVGAAGWRAAHTCCRCFLACLLAPLRMHTFFLRGRFGKGSHHRRRGPGRRGCCWRAPCSSRKSSSQARTAAGPGPAPRRWRSTRCASCAAACPPPSPASCSSAAAR
jgi:hypothetical protein